MPYVDVNGVSMFYEVVGSGEPVVFLHGDYGSARGMHRIAENLSGYTVYAPERAGHGRTADRGGALHYADFADDYLALMNAVGLESAHFVGFSGGAVIAMLVALGHPERVRSLTHISGVLHPGDDSSRPADDIDIVVPLAERQRVERDYDELSPDGPGHRDDVFGRVFQMGEVEPQIDAASLSGLRMPVLVMAGDHDAVRLGHTELIRRSIPGAQLAIVPDASHMLVHQKPALVAHLVQDFLDGAGR